MTPSLTKVIDVLLQMLQNKVLFSFPCNNWTMTSTCLEKKKKFRIQRWLAWYSSSGFSIINLISVDRESKETSWSVMLAREAVVACVAWILFYSSAELRRHSSSRKDKSFETDTRYWRRRSMNKIQDFIICLYQIEKLRYSDVDTFSSDHRYLTLV